ncbi:MAG: sugar phosphate isomerase/epimerase, partial [Calditrichaeota bacterium]
MNNLSRRQFIAAGALGFAALRLKTAAAEGTAENLIEMPPGCQVYGVRERLVTDLSGVLKELYDAGYRLLEFCSPPGYSWDGGGFTPLLNLSAQEIKRQVDEAGLRMVSCHYQYQELLEHLDERIEFAKLLGLEHMVVASVGRPETLDAWLECADHLNKIGSSVRDAGMKLVFHNHTQEWQEIDGVLVFDALTKRFDPSLVNWQFHLQNPLSGPNPIEVLTKYSGRILSLHIMDYSNDRRGSTPVGQGVIEWKKLFAAAQ